MQMHPQSDQSLTSPHTIPHTPPVVPIGVHDLRAQREWEDWQTQRGIERYRNSLSRFNEAGEIRRKSLDELEPGQVIAQDLIGPMVEAVRGYQAKALDELRNAGRAKTANVDWLMTALPPETLAAVTVLHALSKADAPANWTGICKSLGGRVQDQYDLERWRVAENASAKERRAGQQEPLPNLHRLMVRFNDEVDRRVFAKWSQKAPLFAKGEWDASLRIQLGTILLELLVTSNAWFEVIMKTEHQGKACRTIRVFQMTEAGLRWVADRHNQNELMRPYLLPMICEPRDHEYIETPSLSLGVA